jgi:hypothetical protein
MPLKGEAKKLYMRAYMKRRYWLLKAFREAAVLRQDRRAMKLALRRLERARRKALENPGAIGECELSLGWWWNQVMEEEKTRSSKSVGVRVPARFESVP